MINMDKALKDKNWFATLTESEHQNLIDTSARLSALAIIIHVAIEELNPAAADDEYYDCEALDCASGIGIAIVSGWLESKAVLNTDGSVNDLFLVKLTDKGRDKVKALMLGSFKIQEKKYALES
jgi:hypothetical protein